MNTKIAVYTSTRADFGILKPLIQRLISVLDFEVRIFVTGTHLEQDFGYTISEIEKYFPQQIFYRVQHAMKEDIRLKSLKIMGELLPKYAEALVDAPPDLAVVLGDRYEALCFGIVCATLGIPFAHLHGGELTLGAIDDKYRHCLTKLADWHFVACDSYRRRVIQLGEKPETVFNVGALGVENALKETLLTVDELELDLGVSLKDRNEIYLFTFHPETQSSDFGKDILEIFLDRLGERVKSKNGIVIVTGTNSDAGSGDIRELISKFHDRFAKNCLFRESLGMIRYLSLMKIATGVVGNSSSGILEAHSLGTPAVNLGSRQKGREREESVIDLTTSGDCLVFDFSRVVALKSSFLASPPKGSIFGDGRTSEQMLAVLKEITERPKSIALKEFYDLPWKN